VRTAAELRDAAMATGLFADYVGDGATVPWQVGTPPLDYLLFAYKFYLDSRWPASFKLHDWLYTPWGGLIAVGREEADLALFEEIFRDSPVDAGIVFAAVRAFGAPYFGTSQTGYNPRRPPESGRNIGEAPRSISGGSPMPIKVVVLFQQTTIAGGNSPIIGLSGRSHQAGWSEHVWWATNESITDLKAALITGSPGRYGLLPARSGVLNANAAIIGVRLYEGGAGRGALLPLGYPGLGGNPCDIPQMSVLCKGTAQNFAVARRWTLRGIPDGQVTLGEFDPTVNFAARLRFYFDALQNFYFRAIDASNVPVAVHDVQSTGLVTLMNPSPFVIGNFLTFRGMLNTVGRRVGATGFVTAIGPMANQFTIGAWLILSTSGGTAVLRSRSLYPFFSPSTSAVRIVTRKVGRPFEQYRGRASRRRT